MKKHFYSASLLLSVGLFQGCESDYASDGGRVRMGIHDPIVRHSKHAWKWPFHREEKLRPAPAPAPQEGGLPPEYQTYEGMDPG